MSAWTGSAFEEAMELERERKAREAKRPRPTLFENFYEHLAREPKTAAPLRRIFEEAPHLLSDEMRAELVKANEAALKALPEVK